MAWMTILSHLMIFVKKWKFEKNILFHKIRDNRDPIEYLWYNKKLHIWHKIYHGNYGLCSGPIRYRWIIVKDKIVEFTQ